MEDHSSHTHVLSYQYPL
uniref:Uncharacterized protein n=1 Tax=Amphimedon queenslandica TaxID=400682 RepID=A0A1X7TA68_AMPQE